MIGTSSLRRKAQLLHLNPNLNIIDIRVMLTQELQDAKWKYDGLIMAAAGIERLGLEKYITEYLNNNIMLSAQGKEQLQLKQILIVMVRSYYLKDKSCKD